MSEYNDIIKGMRTIQEVTHTHLNEYYSASDVTTKSLLEIYKDMGYELQQLENGQWVLGKTTTGSSSLVTESSIPYQEPLPEPPAPAPAPEPTTQSTPVNARVIDVKIDPTVTTKLKNTLGIVKEVSKELEPIFKVVGAVQVAADLVQFGYRVTTGQVTANPATWQSMVIHDLTTFPGTGGSPAQRLMLEIDGQPYLHADFLQNQYNSIVDIEAGQGNTGIYYDENGNEIPVRFATSVHYELKFPDSNRVTERDVFDVTSSDGIFGVALIQETGGGRNYHIYHFRSDPNTLETVEVHQTRYYKDGREPHEYTYTGARYITASGPDYDILGTTYYDGTSYFSGYIPNYITSINVSNSTLPYCDVMQPMPTTAIPAWSDYINAVEGMNPPQIQKIVGATNPTRGGTIAATYPEWWGRRIEVNGINDDDDSFKIPIADLPTNIYLPVTMPDDYFIENADNQDVAKLLDGTYNQNNIDPHSSPEYRENIRDENDEQTKTQEQQGTNPSTPTPTVPSTSTGDPGGALPGAGIDSMGMVAIYHPTKTEVAQFSQWLWTPTNFADVVAKMFQDPMQCIISMHMLFATPTDAGTDTITLGFIDSQVSSAYVEDTIIQINCGTVYIPEYYKNALDYDPYTTFDVYLPFVGFRHILAGDIVGKYVSIIYNIDIVTGTCVAYIYTRIGYVNTILYSFEGNCAVQIPLSSANFSSIVSGVLGAVVGGAATLLTGGAAAPVAALGIANAAINSRINVERSGSLAGNAGMLSPKKPYIITRRPQSKVAYKYNELLGYPASTRVKLSKCEGYTRIKEIHLEDMKATDREKQKLYELCKNGIII